MIQAGGRLVPGAGKSGRFPWYAPAFQLSPVLPHRQAGPPRPCTPGMTKVTLNVVFAFVGFLLYSLHFHFSVWRMITYSLGFTLYVFFQECVTLLHSISFFAFEGMYLFSYPFSFYSYFYTYRTDFSFMLTKHVTAHSIRKKWNATLTLFNQILDCYIWKS